MDDESYFSFDGSDGYGNDYYYDSKELDISDDIKYKSTEKFNKKLLVWIAISEKGCSQVFIAPANNAINSKIYIKECIKRLNKFINTYHADGNYLFWPDLTSAHYAKNTLKELEERKIKYLQKSVN